MTPHNHHRTINEQLYRALLRLYPAEFRQEYGEQMAQTFRDMHRTAAQDDRALGLGQLWLRTLWDLLHSVIAEHLEQRGVTVVMSEKIGRYEIKHLLGSGDVGAVYRVHDPVSGEDRALKMRYPHTDRAHNYHFRTQAARLQALDHPGLPKCHDFVETDDQVYLVLDLIEGVSLDQALADTEGHLPPATVAAWGISICEALEYMHAQTPPIMARDLPPAELIVDATGRVHLVDLGLIHEYEPGRELAKIGREGYSAPEQYAGFPELRTDVFVLGATLHHLLTGRDPREHPPFTFTDALPRTINPAIPVALETAIMRAVEQDPAARFQSIAEFKAALQATL